MSEIYYIFKKTCYYNKYTDKVSNFNDQQIILTTKEKDFEIPIAFSSVEKAREYLINQLHLEEIAFLNFKSNYNLINEADMLFKYTMYSIKESEIN